MTNTRIPLNIPELELIAITRACLGAGVSFLIGEKMSREQRKALGWGLLLVGAATTVPILQTLYSYKRHIARS